MFAADAIVLAALAERGIVPDMVLGHSYGEFAALYAAGAWDLETTIRLTRARCEGIAAAGVADSGLLATDAAPQLIESLAAGISSELHIANYNAPDQSVVGGRRTHFDALARSLESHSHQARTLPVPAAFHTPLMHGASRLLEQALAGATTRPLRIPLASTVTNTLVGGAADIGRNLTAQLTTPVRYAQLIAQLAGEQPSVFVEVGPQQTLTRLNRRILDVGAWLVASDNSKRPGVEPIVCVQAMLECLGAFSPAAQHPQKVLTKPSSPNQPVTPTKPMQDSNAHPNIPHFDATERRRAKMRGTPASSPAREQNGHAAPPPANGNGQHHADRTSAPRRRPRGGSRAEAGQPRRAERHGGVSATRRREIRRPFIRPPAPPHRHDPCRQRLCPSKRPWLPPRLWLRHRRQSSSRRPARRWAHRVLPNSSNRSW